MTPSKVPRFLVEMGAILRVTAQAAVITTALAASTLAAQAPPASRFGLGFSVGAAATTGAPHSRLSWIGPAGSLFVRWSAAPRLALTVEALASHFGETSQVAHAPCPLGVECISRPTGPVTVGALAAGIQWADSAVALGERGSYLILGGGLYHALNHPSARGATRLGWTAGFGFILSTATPRLSLEVRYHQIPRWPGDRISLIPVTLAFAW